MVARTTAESCVSSAVCAALSLTPARVRPRISNPPHFAAFASALLLSAVGVRIGALANATVTAGVSAGRSLCARKTFGIHSHNHHGDIVEPDPPAKRCGRASELARPKPIADDGNGLAGCSIVRR